MTDTKQKNIIEAQKIYSDYLLMLAVPVILSVKSYGLDAVKIIAVSVITSWVLDFISGMISSDGYFAGDLSAVCSGLIIAMMMPAGIKFYIPLVACAFAMLVVKIPFGGGIGMPFVPAAAGYAFAAVCFGDSIFACPVRQGFSGVSSIGSLLMSGKSLRLNPVNVIDILCGNTMGPIGTGCIIVMLACCVFLFVRRRNALIASCSFILTVSLIAAVFPRTNSGILDNIFLELCSGSLLFAAVFLLTDYSSVPKKSINKITYGIFCAVMCMAMRKAGIYEEPVCFAVLLANAFSPLLDDFTDRISKIMKLRTSGRGAEAK